MFLVRALLKLQASDAVTGPAAVLRVKSLWLIGFGLVATAQLVFVIGRVANEAAVIATWILAPVLAIWVWRTRGPKLLVLALLLCGARDVLGNPRAIGMGQGGLVLSVAAYVGANVCLIILFVREGALTALRKALDGTRRWRVGISSLYLVAAIIGLALAWSSLAPMLRVIVAIYLLLLAGIATTALALDISAGVGAALLFGSGLLAELEVAGRLQGAAMSFRLAVLTLYMLGILLIAIGVLNPRVRTRREAHDGIEPGQRAG